MAITLNIEHHYIKWLHPTYNTSNKQPCTGLYFTEANIDPNDEFHLQQKQGRVAKNLYTHRALDVLNLKLLNKDFLSIQIPLNSLASSDQQPFLQINPRGEKLEEFAKLLQFKTYKEVITYFQPIVKSTAQMRYNNGWSILMLNNEALDWFKRVLEDEIKSGYVEAIPCYAAFTDAHNLTRNISF